MDDRLQRRVQRYGWDKAASYYEEQVDNLVDNLTALMEPMIMAVLGVLVGGLIIAMYLPIFQLGAVVGG